jgi:hypothetical protein
VTRIGEPRLVSAGGQPVRYLTPLEWGDVVGGFVASDPVSGEVVSWPAWGPGPDGPVPLLALAPAAVDRLLAARDPRVHELVPPELSTAHLFAVDPARLPGAYLIERFDALPFKNQEERHAWVEQTNRERRMRTRWRYRSGFQEPSYKCLSYASSTVADWWGLIHGHPISGHYQNFVNGTQEYGVDPRALEVLYLHRARRRIRPYRLAPRLPMTLDPVTRERIPSSSMAFAHLLCTPEAIELSDPLTRSGLPGYRYWPGMWHMDGPPRVLFRKGMSDPAAIREALHRHGIVLAITQARMLRFIRFGLHGIPIVGYFQKDGETLFVYHESYGNHGPGYVWDNSGGPCYMTIPARMLREASSFPHRLWLDVRVAGGDGGDGGDSLIVIATHSGGGAATGTALEARDAGGATIPVRPEGAGAGCHRLAVPAEPARIELEARREHFLRADGSGHRAVLPWGGASALPLAISRWLMLCRELEESGADPRPAHVLSAIASTEDELLAIGRRRDLDLGDLSPLARVLVDRELSRLQGTLLPRLAGRGLDPEIVARLVR